MMLVFETDYWSINLPDDWEVEEQDECVTVFEPASGRGALQISHYFKTEGSVTNWDLIEFAQGDLPTEIHLVVINLDIFAGMFAKYIDDGTFWRKWYLRKDRMLLYITYNCDAKDIEIEGQIIDRMIRSLC